MTALRKAKRDFTKSRLLKERELTKEYNSVLEGMIYSLYNSIHSLRENGTDKRDWDLFEKLKVSKLNQIKDKLKDKLEFYNSEYIESQACISALLELSQIENVKN